MHTKLLPNMSETSESGDLEPQKEQPQTADTYITMVENQYKIISSIALSEVYTR